MTFLLCLCGDTEKYKFARFKIIIKSFGFDLFMNLFYRTQVFFLHTNITFLKLGRGGVSGFKIFSDKGGESGEADFFLI